MPLTRPSSLLIATLMSAAACAPSTSSTGDSQGATNPGAEGDDAGAVGPGDAAATTRLSTLGCTATPLAPGMHAMTLKSGGLDRTYLLWVPSGLPYNPTKPAPVVLELHGGGGRASSFDNETLWSTKGNQSGFLVIAPDGLVGRQSGGKDKEYWNSGPTCGVATTQNVDDVGFIRDLLQTVATVTCVDPKRIFAAGHSEGAGMSHRLACELSDLIAAIAPASNAATLYPEDPATHPGQIPAYTCNVKSPVSVFEMHGKLDCTNPYDGGYVAGGGCNQYNPNVPSSFVWWGSNDGCTGGSGDPVATTISSTEGDVSCTSQRGCPAGTDVTLCTFEKAGHEWFGSGKDACTAYDPNVVPIATWKATDYAWAFFAAHPKAR